MIALPSLHALVANRRPTTSFPRCELCTTAIGEGHRHVVELGKRGVLCVCTACAILFARAEPGARFRAVPDRFQRDPEFAIAPGRWAALGIPVGLAFCFRDSVHDCGVVCYPGPAGIVDAELTPAAWDEIASATRLAAALEDDVEALLVRGEPGAPRMMAYLVPISAAFELAGRLRATWIGFSGGDVARREIEAFFARLEGARP